MKYYFVSYNYKLKHNDSSWGFGSFVFSCSYFNRQDIVEKVKENNKNIDILAIMNFVKLTKKEFEDYNK